MSPFPTLTPDLIYRAIETLQGHIRETPLEFSPELTGQIGHPVYLKLENLQRTGSFKIRGAFFRLCQLTDEERRGGVATCSAGNHGRAVAVAAKELGIKATVFVPKNVDETKYQKMLAEGAQVIRSEFVGFDETQSWAVKQCASQGLTYLSAYDDEFVMAANGGSLVHEVLKVLPEVGTLLIPVGGGGMAAGMACGLRGKTTGLIGCQLEASPALQLSLDRGQAVTELPGVDTLAGGLEGGLGARTFPYFRERLKRVVLCQEQELYQAMHWLLDTHQYLMEPSSAVTVAALLSHREEVQPSLSGPTVVVVSGRNISLTSLKKVLASE